MGYSRWSEDDWKGYSSTTSTKRTEEIFEQKKMLDKYNPALIKVRESRDSVFNPESNAIIIASDCTGSMGKLAENLIRTGIGKVFESILERSPVSDPHLLVMGFGDVACDTAPLQVTEFEPDINIAKQLEEIFIEGGGGGNRTESYNAPWYFAAKKTSIDCFEKRNKKGYLFTMGDEEVPHRLSRYDIKKIFNEDLGQDFIDNDELLKLVGEKYEVFHLMIEEGSHMRFRKTEVIDGWRELLGQRAVLVSDYTKLAEIIVSTIELCEGVDLNKTIQGWDSDTASVVAQAVKGFSESAGVVKL
jgi:hypothetical protein